MKRIMALVLSVFLLTSSALAAEVDFSAMSVEDLRTMRSNIEAELIERGMSDDDLIYQGVYVVGKDIKAGAYIISLDDSNDFSGIMRTFVFSNVDDYTAYMADMQEKKTSDVAMIKIMSMRKGEECYVDLEDGRAMLVGATCRIRSAEDESWRP